MDHFGYSENNLFCQRYLVNFDFWNAANGTVFFYTGNEGSIEMFANNTGFMWENAERFNALLVFAEHRYYGESLPFGNESFTNKENRGYLTAEQALADYAFLISYLKTSIPGVKRAPIIAFGGSYGGMLAAWMRMKYPHLIIGALASSAPILQFGDLTPCGKFSEIVTNDFALCNPACAKSISKSWKAIRKLSLTSAGLSWLTETYNLCEALNSTTVDQFVNWLVSTWGALAMTNYPYATNFLVPLPANPVCEACSKIRNTSISDEKKLLIDIFKAASVFQNYTGESECFNLSQAYGKSLGDFQWDYQSCTEMVMPMCQNGINDMFEVMVWNFTTYSQDCFAKWQVEPELNKAVMMYGGKNILASSNILFSNGDLDPWSGGGVLTSLSDTLIAIRMKNAAHHLDLRESNPNDPPDVKAARNTILKWISKWIQRSRF